MGSCISKCMPKTQHDQDYDFVHDKLVILPPPPSIKPEPAFPKPVLTQSNFSTFSNRSTSSIFSSVSTSSCSSSLSTASSAMSPRIDRSFSNDFLLSCVKENPHIIHLGKTNGGPEPLLPVQEPVHGEEAEPVLIAPSKQYMAIPAQRMPSPSRTVIHKRVRSSSPVIARQKSMRVTEPEGFGTGSYYSSPARYLKSPSPSRRLGGEKGRLGISAPTQMEIVGGSKRLVAPSINYYSKMNKVSPLSSSTRKENSKVASPNNNPGRVRDCLSGRDTGSSHDTKMEEIEGKLSSTTVRDILGSSEDIDDPLIALDCFIFI